MKIKTSVFCFLVFLSATCFADTKADITTIISDKIPSVEKALAALFPGENTKCLANSLSVSVDPKSFVAVIACGDNEVRFDGSITAPDNIFVHSYTIQTPIDE